MSKKRSVTSRPAAADRGAPPPPTAPESAPTSSPSAEDLMRDPGPVPEPDAASVDLGAVTADRYRLILALERAAIRGHGLDSDRALHMEAATMIRSLLDLAPDADLTQPYTTGPVVNEPPIGSSL